MDDIALLIDLHLHHARQGPGGAAETALAIALSGVEPDPALKIADIGCGTGAAALILAETLGAEVFAIDLLPEFLARLESRAGQKGLSGRIKAYAASMEALPFAEESLDLIWSEGAVYNIGFEAGVREWRRFLKPGGILAVSELTWLTRARPKALEEHWNHVYPEVGTAAEKIAQLERQGYSPLGYFPLPPNCWLDNYYRPLEASFEDFLIRQRQSEAAKALVAAEREEIALYERYRDYVSYGFYVARKPGV